MIMEGLWAETTGTRAHPTTYFTPVRSASELSGADLVL